MDFKKEKSFTAVLCVFGAICLAGLAFCVMRAVERSQTQAQIQKNQSALQKLSKRPKQTALSEENLEREEANFQRVQEAVKRKIGLLDTSVFDSRRGIGTDDPQQFRSDLISLRGKEIEKFTGAKIAVDAAAEYLGFSRYLAGKNVDPARESLPLLSLEQRVVWTLTDRLFDARARYENMLRQNGLLRAGEHAFLSLKEIRREAKDVPLRAGVPVEAMKSDELSVSAGPDSEKTGLYRISSSAGARAGVLYSSLRRKDAIDAVAFQIVFIASTDVLRNFVADFSLCGVDGRYRYPIYVRDVAVVPATQADIDAANRKLNPEVPDANAGANAFDIFGAPPPAQNSAAAFGLGEPAAPAVPVKSVVRPETLSQFTVTLEYVKPLKKSSDLAEENTGEEN